MAPDKLRITYLTAGAAGMFCGSCLNDNAIAKSLIEQGHDALLVPVYTPIRTDDIDVSIDQVFLGGINVYLQQKIPLLAYLPTWVDKFLNNPSIIAKATKDAGKTSPKLLGELSISMLHGLRGRQRKEFQRLIHWLEKDIQPDIVVFTNLLIGGFIPQLKRVTQAQILVTLQGDDIFLESLHPHHREEVLRLMKSLVQHVDCFIVHSERYGDQMKSLLAIPEQKIKVVPLGIPVRDFATEPFSDANANAEHEIVTKPSRSEYVIGYLARMAPEKGLHRLVDAFVRIANLPGYEHVRLKMAGWMGPQHADFWAIQRAKLQQANLDGRWEYVGAVDRKEKTAFLKSLDLFCVPTVYEEPKGLFLLEAVAAGVPYLQPDHGAFSELHKRLVAFSTSETVGHLFAPKFDEQTAVAVGTPRKIKVANEPKEGTRTIFSGESVPEGDLEAKLRLAIESKLTRYDVSPKLLQEIDIRRHAERIMELIKEFRSGSVEGPN